MTTDTYLYDDANRLTSVNGVTYTWDNNGNLLNDGVNAYTYDSANRLKTMTGPSVAASYGYNGLNDRLQEIVNGQTTTFTMDLNTGLTQALSDGTNTYIYGNGRIAQVNTGTEYFLGDALGSVRQLTNDSGAITYASAYDPYGVTTQTYGASQSAYGYTNEYTSQELIYLRSRLYDPASGRFTTRDSWQGDYNRPLSLNRWMYVEGNPVNYTDPSGYIEQGMQAKKADLIVQKLKQYNVHVEKDWGYPLIPSGDLYYSGCEWEKGNWRNAHELQLIFEGVKAMAKKLGGVDNFKSALAGRPITFRRMSSDYHSDGKSVAWTVLDIKIYNKTFGFGDNFARGVAVHELAHVWDTRQWQIFRLSADMASLTRSYKVTCAGYRHGHPSQCRVAYDPKGVEEPPTDYAKTGVREDFAVSFTMCVYPTGLSLNLFPIRKDYIEGLINGNKCSQ